jgi:hypothetical protein
VAPDAIITESKTSHNFFERKMSRNDELCKAVTKEASESMKLRNRLSRGWAIGEVLAAAAADLSLVSSHAKLLS